MDLFSNKTLLAANLETGKHVECPKTNIEVDHVGAAVWVSYHLPNGSVLGLHLSASEAREMALELAAVANEAQGIDASVYLASVTDDGVVILMDAEPVN